MHLCHQEIIAVVTVLSQFDLIMFYAQYHFEKLKLLAFSG
jgi:hypothetical protein